MTFGELKKKYPGFAFTRIAGEDIKGGFGRKGWSLYGNCDDMSVRSYAINNEVVYATLGNWK